MKTITNIRIEDGKFLADIDGVERVVIEIHKDKDAKVWVKYRHGKQNRRVLKYAPTQEKKRERVYGQRID